MSYKAVNWNRVNDPMTKVFWDQNIRQFWVDEEIPISDDKQMWFSNVLSDEEKKTYEHVIVSLTLLDTIQGGEGINNISDAIQDLHDKAVLQYMAFMEQMHAKSYSSIFSTLSTLERIDELFLWVENNPIIQEKVKIITSYYKNLEDEDNLFMAMVASVFLETFLFYSGFFFPLYLSGQGKMINSGEIFNLIIRDESVHGVYVGYLAQKIFAKFDENKEQKYEEETKKLMKRLMEIEDLYTEEIYEKINLVSDVKIFIRYNADKALMNLGFDPYYEINVNDVNPVVINGLNTETKNHDFFSTKGNGYIKTTNVQELDDEVFDFE